MEEEIDVQGGLVDRGLLARPTESRRRRDILAGRDGVRNLNRGPLSGDGEVKTVSTPTVGVREPLNLSEPTDTTPDTVAGRQQFEQAQDFYRQQDYAQSGAGQVDDMNINPETGKPYTALERAQQQERSARYLLQDKRQELAKGAEERNQQIVDMVEAEYKPIIEEGVRANQQTETEGSIQDALTAAGRGNRAQLRAQRRDDAAKQLERRIQAQKRAQLDLRLAQAAGEDEAIIETLRNRATKATQAVDQAYGEIDLIEKEQSEFDRQLQLSELTQQQNLERIRLQEELRRAPTTEQKRENVLEQIQLGGPEFFAKLQPQQVQELERQGGFTSGFLNAYNSALAEQQRIAQEQGSPVQRSFLETDDFGNGTLVIVREDGTTSQQSIGKISKATPSYNLVKDSLGTPTAVFNDRLGIVQNLTQEDLVGDGSSAVAQFSAVFQGSSANPYGIDLAGKKGSPITSSGDQIVVFAGENGGWGNQVRTIDPNTGEVHQYSHLENFNVAPGQYLPKGFQLGTMGNTGNVMTAGGRPVTPEERAAGRGTHLDYTVYRPGIPEEDLTAAVDLNSRYGDKVYDVETAMEFAGVGKPKAKEQELLEAVMTPGGNVQFSKLSQKERSAIASDLAKARQKALATGDIKGAMLASAGGSAPNQGFKETFKQSLDVINGLENLTSTLMEARGVDEEGNITTDEGGFLGFLGQGPIIGRLRSLDPTDVQSKALQAQVQQLVPQIARGIFNEVGVLTDQDIARYMRTIPSLTQESQVQDAVGGLLLNAVKNGMDNLLRVEASSGVDVSGLYPEYERITARIRDIENRIGIENDPTLASPMTDDLGFQQTQQDSQLYMNYQQNTNLGTDDTLEIDALFNE